MRLVEIELEGFRGFRDREVVDLDADVVVIFGPNGQGKTSLFDAVSWGLTGHVPRFDSQSFESLFSQGKPSHVRVDWRDASNIWSVQRTGTDSSARVSRPQPDAADPVGESALERLLGAPARAGDELRDSARRFYLEQDAIREYLFAFSSNERFAAIGKLVGSGRLIELQQTLERERRSWSSETTSMSQDRDAVESRLTEILQRQEGLESEEARRGSIDAQEFDSWWDRARGVSELPSTAPQLDSEDAISAMERAIASVRQYVARLDRRRHELDELAELLVEYEMNPVADVSGLRATVSQHQDAVAAAERGLEAGSNTLRSIEAERRRLADEQKSLRLLAESALGHLGDVCPVCEQDYNRSATEARLREMLQAEPQLPELPDLTPLEEGVRQAQDQLVQSQSELRSAETKEAIRHRQATHIREVASEYLQLGDARIPGLGDVEAAIREADEEHSQAQRLLEDGERFASDLARVGQHAQIASLASQAQEARNELEQLDKQIRLRGRAKALADRLVDRLRHSSELLVTNELEGLNPLIGEVYSSVDPHPFFRSINLATRTFRGNGQLWAEMSGESDELPEITAEDLKAVLSSSQMNVTALAVFLAMNLRLPQGELRTMILDDPIQSLDDLNVLGFLDLLRRIRETRQIVISTHDRRLVRLIARKLRPVHEGHRTLIHQVGEWSVSGPRITTVEVPTDSAIRRLPVSA